MKKFYELRMKNGRSFIASTDKDGICQFSINEKEFSIYAEGSDNRSLTFSVGKLVGSEEDINVNVERNKDLEVVSLQELVLRKNRETRSLFKEQQGSCNRQPQKKGSSLKCEENLYQATHGGIQTPAGWINA